MTNTYNAHVHRAEFFQLHRSLARKAIAPRFLVSDGSKGPARFLGILCGSSQRARASSGNALQPPRVRSPCYFEIPFDISHVSWRKTTRFSGRTCSSGLTRRYRHPLIPSRSIVDRFPSQLRRRGVANRNYRSALERQGHRRAKRREKLGIKLTRRQPWDS